MRSEQRGWRMPLPRTINCVHRANERASILLLEMPYRAETPRRIFEGKRSHTHFRVTSPARRHLDLRSATLLSMKCAKFIHNQSNGRIVEGHYTLLSHKPSAVTSHAASVMQELLWAEFGRRAAGSPFQSEIPQSTSFATCIDIIILPTKLRSFLFMKPCLSQDLRTTCYMMSCILDLTLHRTSANFPQTSSK